MEGLTACVKISIFLHLIEIEHAFVPRRIGVIVNNFSKPIIFDGLLAALLVI